MSFQNEYLLQPYKIIECKEGGMGRVYIVEDEETGNKLAVKTYGPQNNILDDKIDYFEKEYRIWMSLPYSRYIVSALSLTHINEIPHIFLEYIPNGNFKDWRVKYDKKNRRGSEIPFNQNFKKWENWWKEYFESKDKLFSIPALTINFLQIVLGLITIKTQGIVAHCDIKPQNLLLDFSKNRALITDFGISIFQLSLAQEIFSKEIDKINIENENLINGCLPYIAPEIIFDKKNINLTLVDVYSFGLTFAAMLTGFFPEDMSGDKIVYFAYNPNEKYSLFYSKLLSMKDKIPPNLLELIIGCINPNPTERLPNFEIIKRKLIKILQESFFLHSKEESTYMTDSGYELKLTMQAKELFKQGNYSLALKKINKALKINDKNISSLNDKGLILIELDQFDIARSIFNKLLIINPKSVEFICNIALSHHREGNSKTALEKYFEGLSICENNYLISYIYFNIGECYLELDDFKKAKDSYLKATSKWKNVHAWIKLSNLYYREEKIEALENCCVEIFKLNPRIPEAIWNVVRLFHKKKEYEACLKWSKVLLKIENNVIGALISIASILILREDRNFRAYYLTAKLLYPDSKHVKRIDNDLGESHYQLQHIIKQDKYKREIHIEIDNSKFDLGINDYQEIMDETDNHELYYESYSIVIDLILIYYSEVVVTNELLTKLINGYSPNTIHSIINKIILSKKNCVNGALFSDLFEYLKNLAISITKIKDKHQ